LKKHLIIVAGGSGTRMNNKIPKQFLLIARKPILFHTIQAFYNYSHTLNIILVLPFSQIDRWKKLCKKYHFNIPHHIVEGGYTRFDSVRNGLNSIHEAGLIAVHDGVRPLVSTKTISNIFNAAEKHGTAIPVIDVNESLRIVSDKTNESVIRSNYKIVQTPQCFKSDILKKAYHQIFNETFTDDASVVEKSGEKIFLVEGNIENIKITTTLDLLIAETLINQQSEK
jgi:2-C-methyl-D-erythritol 4-phosphate cytidylyltransferase